jgi:ABC-2 type transport system ATP-binding protein
VAVILAVEIARCVIVDVKELRKTYQHWTRQQAREVCALRGVSLHACAGEVFGLLGPNGAGKTTLIKTLLGVVRASSGSATLFGKPAGSRDASMRVGYLPESLRIDRHHTARSALRFYGRMSGMSEASISRRSDELLQLVGLAGRDRESVKRFSKGMYQRLGLAQSLMHDPDLLVLDEPTDGLDPVGRNQVRQVLEFLRSQGKTIFLNSHILQEVELVCSRVAILASGEIRGMGTIDELAKLHGEAKTVFKLIPSGANESAESLADRLCQRLNVDRSLVQVTQELEAIRLELGTNIQSSVDQTIDLVREGRFSIISLSVIRPSLEQTFLKLVESPSSVPSESEALAC